MRGSTAANAAVGMRDRLRDGGDRPPIRVALIRTWQRHRLMRGPIQLTGPRALSADVPFAPEAWIPVFL